MLKLIMAGQVARRRTLEPLRFFDLEPGDDAVLFALDAATPISDPDLAELTGQSLRDLLARLQRLTRLGLVTRDDATTLSPSGQDVAANLVLHWQRLDARLLAGVKKKHRRRFLRLLDRMIGSGLL
ncbi:MAG: hypothetical protein H6873_12255 [Hyphomicrobiaceae bacterium]|nr:hypothetical protein [Hyphomicrobiaceae bacterium]